MGSVIQVRLIADVRRHAVRSSLVCGCIAAAVCAVVATDPARSQETLTETTTEPNLFAGDSFWNQPLPADAPLDRSSDALVKSLRREVNQDISTGTGPWIATNSYSTPIYEVPADQPTVPVQLDDFGSTVWWRESLALALAQVPIPPDAEPAKGTDGHLTVWQPSTDRLWEFWKARKELDGWHARWGGAMENVSQSSGYYSTDSWLGGSHHWGATATGLPVVGGVMTLDEFEAGKVEHALALNIPYPRAKEYSFPAQRSDGTSTKWDSIPEGAIFRIDPDLNLDALKMHPVTRMMAEAVQKYGMVVRDRTKDAVGFAAEDPSPTGTDPYREPDGGYFKGKSPSQFLKRFPWDDLELLKMTLCTKEYYPCPPPG